MKRFISVLLILVLILSLVFSISTAAIDYGFDLETSTHSILMKNIETGNIIINQNADEKMYPASTTKIMTYIIVAENVDDFDNTMVTIKEGALDGLDPESSVMGLADHVGESFSVRELLYGLMVSSGNDAAWILADYVGNGVQNFITMMNDKAQELGCKNTHFVNPHGLHSDSHYTTACDLMLITEHALTLPSFSEITNTTKYLPKGFDEEIKTSNYLIDKSQQDGYYYYEYAKGIKTGYTDEAGKCIVSSAYFDDYSYILVELGSPYTYEENINYAMLDAKSIYDWAFNTISYMNIVDESQSTKEVDIKYVWGDKQTKLTPSGEVKILLPKDYDKNLVKYEIDAPDEIEAPIASGDKYGTVSVYYDNDLAGTVELVATEDIKRDELNYFLVNLGDFIKEHIILIIIIVLVIIALIVIISVSNKRRKKREAERRARRYRR